VSFRQMGQFLEVAENSSPSVLVSLYSTLGILQTGFEVL
jgi:hypothetical protein